MRNNKVDVTAATVQQWAEETLEEWLAGYTEVEPRTLTQYKLVYLGDERFRVSRANPIGDPGRARVFKVVVSVEELL